MEFPHGGESIFYRYQAIFLRDWFGDLLYCTGPDSERIKDHWDMISIDMEKQNYTDIDQAQFHRATLGQFEDLEMYELRRANKVVFTGMFLTKLDGVTTARREFESFYIQLILRQIDFAFPYTSAPVTTNCPDESTPEVMARLFDRFLRYQGEDDKWDVCGRSYFMGRVRHFTSQGLPIEFCLPAFPCKSSNRNKVTGKDPDRGEQLALERLHFFAETAERIYSGGAKIWIISDGHVFSDCIGVDDQDVDSYGQKLIEMNNNIGKQRGKADRVGFKSLMDLFEIARYKRQSKLAQIAKLDIPEIEHNVETQVTMEAEFCRRLLMAGCQSQRSSLRARINLQDPAILALYRGFSRFMLEDLELHPFTQAMSRSKQKKLSSKVAFEMIMRNQAYSNLVELLYPNHIRLSIHAHNNAGPKFGIQLFDPATTQAVESLSPDSGPMVSRDLLHIPTPWHNCVVKVAGDNMLYVTKSKAVREALLSGMTGGLDAQSSTPGSFGPLYFALYPNTLVKSDHRIQELAKQEEVTAEPQKPVESQQPTKTEEPTGPKQDTETKGPVEPQQVIAPAKEDTSLENNTLDHCPPESAADSAIIMCESDYVFV
ncbi:Pyoverdine/dityrosine biosynthesis protein-domain-containing protein [Hypoxylon trugodes]|uniref:Pyoverdine/dityrosine biosynthesis protein-domain-containing protein n=1 Tax=Hypoxylon trugodes TaxID=326681 RepID=UPI00219F6B92|nr:Pyoverdine/dityrosine biosynthesis protein-domain-containing protein [Hypoxylon trugodes]KAI1384202.1 Pyoverdine/dityrosine biosynthesis protein-domain-containing protein [Hypoxylon trugodes]